MTLDEMLKQPWTWIGPRHKAEDGDSYFELRVAELPDFFVLGETALAARDAARDALAAFLASYTDGGEIPPLPQQRAAWLWSSAQLLRPVNAKRSPQTAKSFEPVQFG